MENRLPTAAAGLSYYVTMTFFPLMICLYSLLGNNFDYAVEILEFVKPFIPDKAYDGVMSFLHYVSGNYNDLMLLLAFSVILLTASAAFRSLETTIGKMQGHDRYVGVISFVMSVLLSLAFLLTMYLAIIVMFLGRNILSAINNFLPFLDLEIAILNLRYLLLFGLVFVVIWLIFLVCKSREDHYSIVVGALVTTIMLVSVSGIFAIFINASIKYPLVYSSLASVIVLMVWLYSCCMVIYCGAAVNIALRDLKEKAIPS